MENQYGEHENVHVKGMHGPQPKQKLLERAREIIRLKHYSIRTERAYLNWMRRYILFHHKRHPQEMRPAGIEAFLTHLAMAGNVARSTQIRPLTPYCFSTEIRTHKKGTLLTLLRRGGMSISSLPSASPPPWPKRPS
jgi:hypothetical protein